MTLLFHSFETPLKQTFYHFLRGRKTTFGPIKAKKNVNIFMSCKEEAAWRPAPHILISYLSLTEGRCFHFYFLSRRLFCLFFEAGGTGGFMTGYVSPLIKLFLIGDKGV